MEGLSPAPAEEAGSKDKKKEEEEEEVGMVIRESVVLEKGSTGNPSVVSKDESSDDSNDDDDDGNDDEEPKYVNHDVCDCCNETGNLICCDSCPTSLHFDCSDPPVIIAPEGKWFCPKCMFIRVTSITTIHLNLIHTRNTR